MDAPAEPLAEPTTAHNMVALLLQLATPDKQEAALCKALAWQEASLKKLQEQRLEYVEQGWQSSWQAQFDLKTALVAEITRVLAERFGR